MRTWGDRKDGIGLVWKSMSRNKRCVTLDLRQRRRPGAVPPPARRERRAGRQQPAAARWPGGASTTSRCTNGTRASSCCTSAATAGAGRRATGPGFGTLAEAMSGFAHLTGQPDGPPTLPPFMLADGVAGHGRRPTR